MSWWQWLLVGLGIWGVPGTLLTLTLHGIQDGFSAVAERILFYSLFFWPIVILVIILPTSNVMKKKALSN